MKSRETLVFSSKSVIIFLFSWLSFLSLALSYFSFYSPGLKFWAFCLGDLWVLLLYFLNLEPRYPKWESLWEALHLCWCLKWGQSCENCSVDSAVWQTLCSMKGQWKSQAKLKTLKVLWKPPGCSKDDPLELAAVGGKGIKCLHTHIIQSSDVGCLGLSVAEGDPSRSWFFSRKFLYFNWSIITL